MKKPVKAAIGSYIPPAPVTTSFAPPPPVAATPVTAASAQPVSGGTYSPELQGTQFTPITTQQIIPTFQETIGAGIPNVDFEYVDYVNDAGQIIKLRKSKSTGELLDPVPEGYSLKTEAVQPTTTGPTTTETTKVVQDEGGREVDPSISVTSGPFSGQTFENKDAATEASKNLYGVTGNRGIDVGGLVSFVGGVASGVPIGAVAASNPGSMGYVGGTPPSAGTGALSYSDMLANVSGIQSGDLGSLTGALTAEQYQARIDAFENTGAMPTGYVGYETGDVVPGMSGAIMGIDGISRNPDGSVARTNGVPTYRSFSDFFNRLSMSTEEKKAADAKIKADAKYQANAVKAREKSDPFAREQEAERLADRESIETQKEALEAAGFSQKAIDQIGKIGASASGKEDAGFGPGTEGYGKGQDSFEQVTSVPGGGMIDEYDEPSGGGGTKDKIVCTAMNNAYGFGSFRQTVWLQHSKTLDPAYQKGYHRIFKPLIKFAYKNDMWYNIVVRSTLEGIARRRTADIWMQKHNKRHFRGAIERAILEPLCYIVGKIK